MERVCPKRWVSENSRNCGKTFFLMCLEIQPREWEEAQWSRSELCIYLSVINIVLKYTFTQNPVLTGQALISLPIQRNAFLFSIKGKERFWKRIPVCFFLTFICIWFSKRNRHSVYGSVEMCVVLLKYIFLQNWISSIRSFLFYNKKSLKWVTSQWYYLH